MAKKLRYKKFMIGKFTYPFRIILTTLSILILATKAILEQEIAFPIILFFVLASVWPHLAYYLYRKKGFKKKIETKSLLIDTLLAGFFINLIQFSFYPSLVIGSFVIASNMALYGIRQMGRVFLSIASGILLMGIFNGFSIEQNAYPEIDLIVSISLSCFFILFAFSTYRRTKILNSIKENLIRQKFKLEEKTALIESERQKSEKLLLNILPQEVAQELKTVGTVKPKYFDFCTVIFTDFKEFTILSEKLLLKDILSDLDKCFLAFDEICVQRNLEKIKTIGDGYLCVGGLPKANSSNPIDAILAAQEMQAFMKKFNQEKTKQNKPLWELKVGLHTGPVVAGVIGTQKFAYDIWGNTVNIASRLESNGKAGEINISGETYELIKDRFECQYRGKIPVKNKGKIDMYFVKNKKLIP